MLEKLEGEEEFQQLYGRKVWEALNSQVDIYKKCKNITLVPAKGWRINENSGN